MSRIRCFVAVTPDTQGHFTDNPALINEYICHLRLVQFDQVAVAARDDGVIQWLS